MRYQDGREASDFCALEAISKSTDGDDNAARQLRSIETTNGSEETMIYHCGKCLAHLSLTQTGIINNFSACEQVQARLADMLKD
jgi:hypothetical protein